MYYKRLGLAEAVEFGADRSSGKEGSGRCGELTLAYCLPVAIACQLCRRVLLSFQKDSFRE